MVLGRIKVSMLWTLWQSTGQSVAVVFVEALWLFSARDALLHEDLEIEQ